MDSVYKLIPALIAKFSFIWTPIYFIYSNKRLRHSLTNTHEINVGGKRFTLLIGFESKNRHKMRNEQLMSESKNKTKSTTIHKTTGV